MNIAICNGDKLFSQQIESLINEFNNQSENSFVYSSFDSFDILQGNIKCFEIAIIKIESKEDIELAKILFKAHPHLITIIVSSNSNFLDDAFEIGAFRYFQMPLSSARVLAAIESAQRRIKANSGFFIMNNRNACGRVYYDDIIYIEIKNRKTILVTENNVVSSNNSMAYWREALKEHNFAVPHNSYIVNLGSVTLYKKSQFVVLNNRYIVNVSRTKGNDFDERYKLFIENSQTES